MERKTNPETRRPSRYQPRSVRRILCVFPRYAPSFGTFQHAYPLMPRVNAFMPPQGLLVIAAYLPAEWEVCLIDENMGAATEDDYRWADAVLISGMHVQREGINAVNRSAHRHGKLTALGGPSVSGCPEYYPDVDVLHVGELGDATDALIEYLDKHTVRPPRQVRLQTGERLPLDGFPQPAYRLVDMGRYFLGSIQFSSGCPYLCEFCDIPELYGRRPRFKTAEQIKAELDTLVAAGAPGAVYFVDDNFIANRKAARALLPHLIEWQRSRGYPVEFACEATLNIAEQPDILEMMRAAYFTTVFCGIETPEPEGLGAIHKEHNMRRPLLDSVAVLNGYGLEVVAGIILGLDTDTPRTADNLLSFIDQSRIPMLTINMLYALPRTPLYRRLEKEGRLEHDAGKLSNVRFKMPYERVVAMWNRCISEAYHPARLLDRFAYQTRMTYPNRITPSRRVAVSQVVFGLRILSRVLRQVGYGADYRRDFWRVAGPLLRAGRIEEVIHIGLVGHHLIRFARDAVHGEAEACFYADPGVGRQISDVGHQISDIRYQISDVEP